MENFRVRSSATSPATGTRKQAITGVNTSGNLEVLAERVLSDDQTEIEVTTATDGFKTLWEHVISDFFERSATGGLRFSINDGGARPDTVTLRLLQSVRLMEADHE